MAGSRLEKIGTIYTRTRGLIQSGPLIWEDRPIWYDVYEAFPPKAEPIFDRPAPNIPLRKIFYEEDKIRATFHQRNKNIGAVNLRSTNKTLTQRFVESYQKIETQYGGTESSEKIYEEALDLLKREKVALQSDESLTTAFKEAQDTKPESTPNVRVKIGDIFKE